MAAKRKKPPEIHVIFDTNAIFTESAAFLLKREVAELITANSSHTDIRIRWYLPHVVLHERQYQMQQNGFSLLPSIAKIERVLSHNLNITEEVITDRIAHLIEEQRQQFNLEILQADVSAVDWSRLILDSAYRRPPFERGEKEKGFRDAVITEAVTQLISSSPTTPRICRIAIVTNDSLLADAVRTRSAGATNVRILADLEELKGLLNTLVSEVSEDFVTRIHDAAIKYFFESGSDDTLWRRERVTDQISERFPNEFASRPEGTDGRELEKILIGGTRFKKKNGQRVHWVTRITFKWKAYKLQPKATPLSYLGVDPSSGITIQSGLSILQPAPSFSIDKPASMWTLQTQPGKFSTPEPLTILGPSQTKVYSKTGQIIFEVTWSVSVSSQRLNFTAPRIESIDYVSADWQEIGA